MNQYGESELVNNPRYQGQSGGTDGRGPQGESRYGAMPLSTGTGQGYAAPREGALDRAKDAVGMAPHSGHDNRRDEPGYGTQGYGQPREGMVDRAKDAVGMGPHSGSDNRRGQPGYDNPNVNHPSEERGFGGGLGQPEGTNTGYDQSENLGSGYDNRMATGADAYGQPRREGMVDRMTDGVGVGPNSGYDDRTRTGIDAYVHGNHPAGMQDRVTGVNEPTMLQQGGDMNLPAGQHVPASVLGERRTEPGYDMATGTHPPSEKLGTGLGHHVKTDYDERRGKGFEDTAGAYGTNTGTGVDNYDGTNTGTETGYDDTDVQHGTGTAPPKKGIVTKIKEKLHHTH